MLKCYSIFTFLLVFSITLNAQNSKIDSLERLLNKHTVDTTKVDILLDLGARLSTNSPSKAIQYINQAEKISAKLKDSSRLALSYNRLGVAYYYITDYTKALEYYLKSYGINQAIGNQKNLANNYNNVGLIYYKLKQYVEALFFTKQAIQVNKKIGNEPQLAQNYNNLGIIYKVLNKRDSAIQAYNQSLKINQQLNRRQSLIYNYNNIGDIHFENKEYSDALNYFLKAYDLSVEFDNLHEQASTLNNIASSSTYLDRFDYAQKCIDKALKIIKNLNSKDLEIENLKCQIDLFTRSRNFKQANEIYDKYNKLKDSLWISQQIDQISQFRMLYETEKKDREIALLRLNNSLQKTELEKQRIIKFSFIAFFLISIVLIILAYRLLILKNKANSRLEKLVQLRTADLQKAKDEAEKSDKLKTSFLSNMSHEVRTPLNAIIGYTYLLENTNEDNKDVKSFIKEISNSGDNLLKLFENITYLTQLENNAIEVKPAKCEVNKIFDALLSKYNKLIAKNNLEITLNCKVDKSSPIEVITDENILLQIFEILIENSIKFTEKGEINFGIKTTTPRLLFFVQDTGFGINPEDINNVFDKFKKFNYTTSRLFEGAGIGLTIAKKNVELLNGEISIQSEPGKGTLVEFKI